MNVWVTLMRADVSEQILEEIVRIKSEIMKIASPELSRIRLLVAIFDDVISGIDFFEFSLCFGIPRIQIWMVCFCQFAISCFCFLPMRRVVNLELNKGPSIISPIYFVAGGVPVWLERSTRICFNIAKIAFCSSM